MCKKGLPAVWTKEKIEEAFAGFVEKNRRLPVAREMKPQYGLPTRRTFERYMDTTAQEYAELRYPTLLSARDERHVQTVLAYRNEVREWSIERLMEAEKNFFTKCGRLPEPYEYTAENGLPMYSVFCRLAKEALIYKPSQAPNRGRWYQVSSSPENGLLTVHKTRYDKHNLYSSAGKGVQLYPAS